MYPFGYGYGGYGYGFRLDAGYIWVLIAMGLSLLASAWVNATFRKYSQVPSTMDGYQAARYVLDHAGLQNIRIQEVRGNLTDNYNPVTKVLSLSQSTYNSYSAAAVGVACHECGHAIQDARNYLPNRIRAALVPVVNIGSNAAIPLFLLGLLFDITGLIWAGIILFSLTLLFGLVTLPVEFNASSRALKILKTDPKFTQSDYNGARKVLIAAASTYLASVFLSLTQLLRYIGIASRNDNRRR
ncbi:zinc metallopeptidase [Erysipelotrichaceae bacterium RD49]|nr:zinc metallopeptidase [Erysipelotrichaceae bacterium RD49]